jgi:hypothetical protein
MDLATLTRFELYNHFINISRAFLNATHEPGTILDDDEIKAVRAQLHEVEYEFERRRTQTQSSTTYSADNAD